MGGGNSVCTQYDILVKYLHVFEHFVILVRYYQYSQVCSKYSFSSFRVLTFEVGLWEGWPHLAEDHNIGLLTSEGWCVE